MANETSDRGEAASSAHDHAPDELFASAHHDHDGDYVFGASQGAGPSEDTANEPAQQVAIKPDDHVIRVQVTPGEILELAAPFNDGADLSAREANGNLAIKVGDVTVILEGFINANNQAPVVVETSDGKPIDVATVIAQTDPTIDIQTAAGPTAAGAQGQGADNTGAILAQLAGGGGLGGFNAVGGQDGTSLTYGTIDNSILQDRFLTAAPLGAPGLPGFSLTGAMSEPVLRDPAHAYNGESYDQFISEYRQVLANSTQGYADYNGTQVGSTTGVEDYLAQTTEHITIPNPGGQAVVFSANDFFFHTTVPTSGGSPLLVFTSTDGSTAYLVRESDNAVVMVFHITDNGADGTVHVDAIMLNHIDNPGNSDPSHPGSDSYADYLRIDFHTSVPNPDGTGTGEGSEVPPTIPGPGGYVDVADDVPVAGLVHYTSFLGNDPTPDEGDEVAPAATDAGHVTFLSTDTGYVDEDWLKGSGLFSFQHDFGNQDQDNATPGSNSDAAHGDAFGRTVVTGNLDIDFGADGPAGAAIPGAAVPFSLAGSTDRSVALALNVPDVGQPFLDASNKPLTSDGHPLVVLSDTVDPSTGIETLIVGYDTTPVKVPIGDGTPLLEGGGQVAVFQLTLDTNPNDHDGSGQDFQDFKFELLKGIDQANGAGEPSESNTDLQFKVTGHDGDGDAVHTAINIQVNDDVPIVGDTEYLSFTSGKDAGGEGAIGMLLAGHGAGVTLGTTAGYVDEDWLSNGNHDKKYDGTTSNANTNGDDIGKTYVLGLVQVNFGGDGPTTQTVDKDGNPISALAITQTWSASDTSNGFPIFKGADAGHTEYTSHGHTLVVLSSDAGHLEVGYMDGEAKVDVFTLTLNNTPGKLDFGVFAFHLDGPIDQLSNANGAETSALIHFGVTATDADFDTAHAAINISVNDDSPEIAITYDAVPGDHTSGGTETLHLSVTTAASTFGSVDEDWLSNGNQNHFGSTTATGHVTVKWGADGPASGNPFAFTATNGNHVQASSTFGGSLSDLRTDNGDTVNVAHKADGSLVGYTGASYVEGTSNEVFTLTINAKGDFTFTLLEAVHHPDSGQDSLYLSFGVSASDFDHDASTGNIVIEVKDDTPTNLTISYDAPPAQDVAVTDAVVHPAVVAPAAYGQVDEDWITTVGGQPNGSHPNQDQDNTPPGSSSDVENGDQAGKTTATGQLSASFGADGQASSHPFTLTATDNSVMQASTTVIGTQSDLKTADGHTVYVTHADGMLVGYANATAGDSTYNAASSTQVFTLNIDSSGKFTFTLLEPISHPGHTSDYEGSPAEDSLYLSFGVAATDGDGDSKLGSIVIQVNDDAPVAVGDCPDPGTLNGNIFTDETFGLVSSAGADGATITQIQTMDVENDLTGTAKDVGSSIMIQGSYGELTIAADGTWSYVPDNPNVDTVDNFQFTITDNDGDTSSNELTIENQGIEGDARLASIRQLTSIDETTGPTHTPGSYQHDVAVTASTLGHPLSNDTYHLTDATGGHTIGGGAGSDLIVVTGSQDSTILGYAGDDIIHVAAGHNSLSGGAGDDTIFGGTGVDDFFGGAGHDAMSGGGGNDVFHDVDAQDLDGTNLLDGTHSIDGGDGFDTVDLGGLKSFDSSQAAHIENVEKLDFSGVSSLTGAGTQVTLSYDAVYNITQIGGLHVLQIDGDKGTVGKDSVHLDATGGHTWQSAGKDGNYDVYTASDSHGGSTVTVEVLHGVHTDVN